MSHRTTIHPNGTVQIHATSDDALGALGGLSAAGDPTMLGAAVNDQVTQGSDQQLASDLNTTLASDMSDDQKVQAIMASLGINPDDMGGDPGDDEEGGEGDEGSDALSDPDGLSDADVAQLLGNDSPAIPAAQITPVIKHLASKVKSQGKAIKVHKKAIIALTSGHNRKVGKDAAQDAQLQDVMDQLGSMLKMQAPVGGAVAARPHPVQTATDLFRSAGVSTDPAENDQLVDWAHTNAKAIHAKYDADQQPAGDALPADEQQALAELGGII